MTRLSIVMAARNAARHIGAALASIGPALAAAPVEAEILLADGGSNDETLTITEGWPGLRVVSRADGGIYDGMNRALSAVQGEYVLILNSDDLVLPGALSGALARLDASPECGFVSGQALFGPEPTTALLRTQHGPLTLEGAVFGIPAINVRLFRAETLRQLGPIRTDLGLAADREWMARLARCGIRGCSYDAPLYFYRVHEGSHTISGDRAGRHRVYRAEELLALQLLRPEEQAGADLERLAHRSLALVRLKLRLSGAKDVRAMSIHLLDLAAGLVLARRWRGRLSGY